MELCDNAELVKFIYVQLLTVMKYNRSSLLKNQLSLIIYKMCARRIAFAIAIGYDNNEVVCNG